LGVGVGWSVDAPLGDARLAAAGRPSSRRSGRDCMLAAEIACAEGSVEIEEPVGPLK